MDYRVTRVEVGTYGRRLWPKTRLGETTGSISLVVKEK